MSDDYDVPWIPIVLWAIAIGLIIFLLNAFGWISFDFWAPKYEASRRKTWEESASHIEGKQQYLVRLYGEWSGADPDHKSVICAVARHEVSTIKPVDIPKIIQDWECVK